MMNTENMADAVRAAWSHFTPPPADNVRLIEFVCGKEAAQAFAGVLPVDVDISSEEFLGCTPLLDLASTAAAAYLGTYMLSLLHGLRNQESTGFFHDLLTRAHLLNCLTQSHFWENVVVAHLPPECQRVLVSFCHYLVSRKELLALTEEQIEFIMARAAAL